MSETKVQHYLHSTVYDRKTGEVISESLTPTDKGPDTKRAIAAIKRMLKEDGVIQ